MNGLLGSSSLALLTDLYELTMAQGYWKTGRKNLEAVFHLFFRTSPFGGGYAVAAGLGPVVDYLEQLRFSEDDLGYLSRVPGADGKRLFAAGFLEELGQFKLICDVDGMPEGTLVFPHEPIVRVQGPILQAQLLESALLNLVNFQTLIATKAARICLAARGEPVLEFGLRRAHGVDGALAASRAAYIGGCAATSNVLAGKVYGIPVRGTHAHSWVMSFDSEREAFEAYAEALPNNGVFLVDTYDSLEGVRRAIEVGRQLRARGNDLLGIRLDSGDLATLSIEARRMLDEAGFPAAVIVASNDLDEHIIESLHEQGARVGVWGVGTKLTTAFDQPALGGVYKLGAVRRPDADWEDRIKLSEQAIKISTPGIQQVRRFLSADGLVGDMIYDTLRPPGKDHAVLVDPLDATWRRSFSARAPFEDLLVPVFRKGLGIYPRPPLEESRRHAREQLAQLPAAMKRLVHPHRYPVGLESGLHERRASLILKARGVAA